MIIELRCVQLTLWYISLIVPGQFICDQQNLNENCVDTIKGKEIVIKCMISKNGNYLIRNEQQYHSQVKINSPHPDCEGYTLPQIDFSQFTLVGVVTSTGGCAPPTATTSIVKCDQSKNYLFTLKIVTNGICKINHSISFWYLIPHITNNENVEFIIN